MTQEELLERIGIAFAELVHARIKDASKWPSRQVSNSLRVYPGAVDPDSARELESGIRNACNKRWMELTSKERDKDYG